MSKSQQTWSKKEREKKKQQKRKEKEEKRLERKENKDGNTSLDDMMVYIDEHGNISDTPPDPSKKIRIKVEDIVIGVPKQEDLPQEELIRNGKVTFFNGEKGYGFIRDDKTQESIFVHVNNADGELMEQIKVSFEVEMGQRGASAINVKILP